MPTTALVPLLLLLLCAPAWTVESATLSEPLPEIVLPMPEDAAKRAYLGLDNGQSATFSLQDIQADILLIELFSMYCPYCHDAAETVNELVQLIGAPAPEGPVIKMIGLGANNTPFEVEHFRKTFDVRFPLFADEDMSWYNSLAGAGTPGFIACRRNSSGQMEIFHRRSGGFPEAGAYLDELLQAYAQ